MAECVVFTVGRDPLIGMGGHSSYIRGHARAVIRAGFEPHIFCAASHAGVLESDFGIIHRIRSSPFRFSPQRVEAGVRKKHIMWHARLIAASVVRFLSVREGPHLIHGFGTWSCAGVIASHALRRRGIEAVPISSLYTTAADESRRRVQHLNPAYGYFLRSLYHAEHLWIKRVVDGYERRAYVESRLVLVNYESVRRLFLAEYGSGPEIRKLPYTSESAFLHGADERTSARVGGVGALHPRDTPLVVAVSRHDPRKGLDVLLHALARLRATGVRFRACLVGGGALLAAHRRLAAELGLGDVTAIVGWVPDPYPYLRQADAFVLPSLQEGSGSLSLIEALQAGVAVVASNVDGIPEDVVDGTSALLVQPGDPAALAAALGQVLKDRDLRARLAWRGRETFETRFSCNALISALSEVYASLGLGSSRG